MQINPTSGSFEHIQFRGKDVILNILSHFWTTEDKELKSYMKIDIHEFFQKKKTIRWNVLIVNLWRHDSYQGYQISGRIKPK